MAYRLYDGVLQRIGPARTSLVVYLIPAFAIGYGITLRQER